MYHVRYRGTHYEAGFHWGSLLRKHQKFILDNMPFAITKDRVDYALSCIPVYEEFYPKILEEIRGLAEGQNCDPEILQTVLFSMYAMHSGSMLFLFCSKDAGWSDIRPKQ